MSGLADWPHCRMIPVHHAFIMGKQHVNLAKGFGQAEGYLRTFVDHLILANVKHTKTGGPGLCTLR